MPKYPMNQAAARTAKPKKQHNIAHGDQLVIMDWFALYYRIVFSPD
jgi:hypothetical protein